jgi:hypothetical protein
LNDGQLPNPNVVRVELGTGYRRVEGNRRASLNGPVSDLSPEIPPGTIRDFFLRRWSTFFFLPAGGALERKKPLLRNSTLLPV